MKKDVVGTFGKYCKSYSPTREITCGCGFTYIKSEAADPNFSLNTRSEFFGNLQGKYRRQSSSISKSS